VANDVTFLGGPSGGVGGQAAPASDGIDQTAKPTPTRSSKKKDEDVVIEDIGDEPINLDDIPF
jgi:hypothetical protein